MNLTTRAEDVRRSAQGLFIRLAAPRFLQLGPEFLHGRPGPFGIGNRLGSAEKIIDFLEVLAVPQKKAGERDCLVRKRKRSGASQRSMRVGMTSQKIMRGATRAGLVLFPRQCGQEPGLFGSKFHGLFPGDVGGASWP
jgi:hypothetical protein